MGIDISKNNFMLGSNTIEDQVMTNLSEFIKYQNPTIAPNNLLGIILYTMQIVEKFGHIKGNQKKFLVVKVIRDLIESNEFSSRVIDKQSLLFILDNVSSGFIDNIILVSKKVFKFNKDLKPKCFSIFNCCKE